MVEVLSIDGSFSVITSLAAAHNKDESNSGATASNSRRIEGAIGHRRERLGWPSFEKEVLVGYRWISRDLDASRTAALLPSSLGYRRVLYDVDLCKNREEAQRTPRTNEGGIRHEDEHTTLLTQDSLSFLDTSTSTT